MDDKTMNPDHQISDELLNAFIDRQITNEERQEILSLIKHDKSLANRICDLQQLKEMTQHAFDDIPQPNYDRKTKVNLIPRMAAVIAIFSLGLLIGFSSIQITSKQQTVTISQAGKPLTKVLVHLTSSNVESGLNTLDNLQQLLDDYDHRKQDVLVEVVANGDGIKLLQSRIIPIARRISELTQLYDNLTFAACKNSIDQIKMAKGLEIKLIPGVKLIDSGIVKVIERQTQGWTYIRG